MNRVGTRASVLPIAICIAVANSVFAQSSDGDIELDRITIDVGGGTASGPEFELVGTLAQPVPQGQQSFGRELPLGGGFWVHVVDRAVGPGSITGTITTNGTIGVLSSADLIDWDLSIDADGIPATTGQLLGPLSGNNSSVTFLLGPPLTATPTALLFDFSIPEPDLDLLQIATPTGNVVWQLQAHAPIFSDELIREDSGNQTYVVRGSVQQQIATIDTLFSDGFEDPPPLVTTVDELGKASSIAIGADGNPVISYHDPTSQALKVAKCTNTVCSESSSVVVDEINNTGWYPSIAIGEDDLPVISYYDRSAGVLKVAKCNDAACNKGDETISIVDDDGDVGAYSSIAIGNDGMPVISYHDLTAGKLKVAKCNDTACTGDGETLTRINDLAGSTGIHTSIAIGADGFPVISYQEFSGPVTSTVKVAKCNDTACAGENEIISLIDDTGVGMFESTAIAIGVDNFPVIAYYDSLTSSVKVAKCNDTACVGGDETLSVVDTVTGSQTLSIVIGEDGWPILSYAALRVAKCDDAACSGGGLIITFVEDFSGAGLTSIAIGDDRLPVISYVADGFKVVHCGTPPCS